MAGQNHKEARIIESNSSIRERVEAAVQIFRANPEASNTDILEKVVASGVDRALATQIVALLPIAYGRKVFSDVPFSDYYICRGRTGRLARLPVWPEALDVARQDRNPPLPIAARSSEIVAADRALKDGKKLEKMVWSPPAFLWPVDSYRDPRKAWWQFWQ